MLRTVSALVLITLCHPFAMPPAAAQESLVETRHNQEGRALRAKRSRGHDFSQGERAFPGHSGEVRKGLIWWDNGTLDVIEYELINGVAVFEGDIILPVDENGDVKQSEEHLRSIFGKSTGRSNTGYRWPASTIPYVIDAGLPDQSRVTAAIAHWEANTAIHFVPRTNQADFVRFVKGEGCDSSVGRQGGAQNVNLADGCSTGNTIHEIGHAVGLWHEQSRTDRDSYIIVNWGNIENGKDFNFKTYAAQGSDGFNWGAYDFTSIMHYGSFDFSNGNGPTITKLDGSTFSAQRTSLTAGDLEGVRYMYHPTASASHWCTDSWRVCHFDGSVSLGLPSYSFEWHFSDAPVTEYGPTVDHTFSSYGQHQAELVVRDSEGQVAYAIVNVDLDPNDPCVICE